MIAVTRIIRPKVINAQWTPRKDFAASSRTNMSPFVV